MPVSFSKYSLLLLLFVSSGILFGQSTTSKTLIIKKNEKYVVGPTNALILDTLIMGDQSSLYFSPLGTGTLIVKTAIIGKKCLISSKGKTTKLHGEDGGDLSLTMNFKSLESLTVDASGGNGANGTSGSKATEGTNGRVARDVTYDSQGKMKTTVRVLPGNPPTSEVEGIPTGLGGSGGDVTLTYGSVGFIINFNHLGSKHGIYIKNNAGNEGIIKAEGPPSPKLAKVIDHRKEIDYKDDKKKNLKALLGDITDGKVTLIKIHDPWNETAQSTPVEQ